MSEFARDRASYRHRGGLLLRFVSEFKAARYFTASGTNLIVKHYSEFVLTDNAILEIGDNCTIQDYAFLQLAKPHPRVYIGNNTVIGRHCMVTAKNLISICNDVLTGAFVQVFDHNHGTARGDILRHQAAEIGEVIIGNDVWIGSGAKFLANAHIGHGAVIGSNAVVTKDIPDYAIAAGVPAKVLRYRTY